jgi:hypothetical protein
VSSPTGPARREIAADGLPAGAAIHALASCGAESASVLFTTGTVGPLPIVKFALAPPSWLGSPPASVVISYGGTSTLGNQTQIPCTAAGCVAEIAVSDPLLYWKAEYRNAGGAPLAVSAVNVKAPR